MKQNLLAGWIISSIILSISFSCSSEMDKNLKNEIEGIADFKKEQNGMLTKNDLWDEEETPLECAETVEGTGPFTPGEPLYFYFGEDPEFKNKDQYNYYAYFDWGAGFGQEGVGDEVAREYYMQIQWSFSGSYYKDWNYIKTSKKSGLVRVLSSYVLEDIPAYAFPYSWIPNIYIRMRTVHEDFICSTPILGGEGLNKYDRSLFSAWCSPAYLNEYYNYWGFGKPQLDPNEGDEEEYDRDGTIIVRVNLPYEIGYPKQYTYSYEITNMTGDYIQYIDGSVNSLGLGKSIVDVIGKKGGSIEVLAKRRENSTGKDSYSSQMINYNTGERTIEVFFTEYDFNH